MNWNSLFSFSTNPRISFPYSNDSPCSTCSSTQWSLVQSNICSWETRKYLFIKKHVLGTLDFTGWKNWAPFNIYYCSFKIFPQFWLAKSTRIILHNQLLSMMTKFGRVLCLMRKWRQKCSPLQVKAPLTKKTWGWGWVVFVVKTRMADTSLVSRVRTTAGTQ